jgi:ABC-type glycerol-3-phosphate transport system substrate-binding protein
MFTKKINRRKFLIMAGTASSAAILVACAPQTQATVNPAPTAVSARIPLEMLMTGEDDNAVHRTAFTIYKDLHPEIDLTISPVPGGFPDLYAKVNARVAAGNPPDMMQLCSYGPVVTWAKKKILLDLKPYTTSDPDFKDNPIPQSLLNSFIQGGELFGIPKDYVPHAAI